MTLYLVDLYLFGCFSLCCPLPSPFHSQEFAVHGYSYALQSGPHLHFWEQTFISAGPNCPFFGCFPFCLLFFSFQTPGSLSSLSTSNLSWGVFIPAVAAPARRRASGISWVGFKMESHMKTQCCHHWVMKWVGKDLRPTYSSILPVPSIPHFRV